MATTRNATTHWEGTLFEGAGKVTLESSGIGTYDVSWASRAEEANGKTSPEELIAAAHSSCFSMALSNGLAKAGTPPTGAGHQRRRRLRPRHRHHRDPADRRGVVEGIERRGLRRRRRGRQGGLPGQPGARRHARSRSRPRWPERRRSAGRRARPPRGSGPVASRGRSGGRLLAVPDDPLRERDLDALVVEAGLDPLAQLAGDRPLLHRRGLEQHPQGDAVGVERLDAPDLGLLDDRSAGSRRPPTGRGRPRGAPAARGPGPRRSATVMSSDGARPVLAHVADPQDLAVADVPDRAVDVAQPGHPQARPPRRCRWPRRRRRRRRRRTGPRRS